MAESSTSQSHYTEIDFMQLGPAVHFAERAVYEPGYVWGPRTIPDCQLLFVLYGQLELTLGSDCHTLIPNTCAFYGPDSPHKLKTVSAEKSALYSIHFDWEQETPIPNHPAPLIRNCSKPDWQSPPREYAILFAEHRTVRIPHVCSAPDLESFFRPVIDEYHQQEPGFETSLRGHMINLLTALVRKQFKERPDPSLMRIAPALEAITHHSERNWTNIELAQLCGYNPTYFAELFKEITGLSPKVYAVRKRIQRAKQLLLSNERITDIALSLGYEDVHYFSRSFKRITGLTPSEFRMQPAPHLD